ncbi:hypothetical protein [Pedobacter panaciterrae]|uniref:hypothetical protein n=1 Tax=Pedobacter panaciterrae TaxID=363849 RepID=UPI0025960ADF|nr:hypothetical protein [uncultured Pedobacter sp.]
MKVSPDELLYTKEHDWIFFAGMAAYTGISRFKLTGISGIDNIALFDYKSGDTIEQGAILLNLHYREYIVPVYAPVACTLLDVNEIVRSGLWDLIVEAPEQEGWLFKVVPAQNDNNHLLSPGFYKERYPTDSIFNHNLR